MHPIPTDFSIDDIVGRQLVQVGVGKWDAQFHFEERTIQSMGRVNWVLDGVTITIFNGEWVDIAPLPLFVGLSASGWTLINDHSFEVVLENHSKLVFFVEDQHYEEIIVHPEMWIF